MERPSVEWKSLEWRPGEVGTGSLLMTQPGLTRRPDGRPHQPVYFFDDQSRPTRLATDDAGAPLGWDEDQPFDDPDTLGDLITLPADVAAAAQHWLATELAGDLADDHTTPPPVA